MGLVKKLKKFTLPRRYVVIRKYDPAYGHDWYYVYVRLFKVFPMRYRNVFLSRDDAIDFIDREVGRSRCREVVAIVDK